MEEILKEIRFVKEGGSCFEFCDYEGMVEDLREKLTSFEKKTKEGLLKRILPERDIAKMGSENQEIYVAYSKGFNRCIKEIKENANKEGINI